jgi:hypothetical protein
MMSIYPFSSAEDYRGMSWVLRDDAAANCPGISCVVGGLQKEGLI